MCLCYLRRVRQIKLTSIEVWWAWMTTSLHDNLHDCEQMWQDDQGLEMKMMRTRADVRRREENQPEVHPTAATPTTTPTGLKCKRVNLFEPILFSFFSHPSNSGWSWLSWPFGDCCARQMCDKIKNYTDIDIYLLLQGNWLLFLCGSLFFVFVHNKLIKML